MRLNLETIGQAVRDINPQLFQKLDRETRSLLDKSPLPQKQRIRQDRSQPNKLELEWREYLMREFPDERFRYGCRRYKLGNGIWYKPDIVCARHRWPETGFVMETAWEVKGPKSWRGGFENLKVAAYSWPEVRWVLVWKEYGRWNEQEVLP